MRFGLCCIFFNQPIRFRTTTAKLLAELIGADVINIHAGGRQGGKDQALKRLGENFPRLSQRVRSRLSLENDEISYSVRDLLPLCRQLEMPLVYDVHHHRCNPDGLSVEEATDLAAETWHDRGGELWTHISSPKQGWKGVNPRLHADHIDPEDFPDYWRCLPITIDVEAKAKELAVLKLKADLGLNIAYSEIFNDVDEVLRSKILDGPLTTTSKNA